MPDTYLSVGVLDGGYVALPESPLDEPEDEGALPNAPSPKNDDPVIVALLWHFIVSFLVTAFNS